MGMYFYCGSFDRIWSDGNTYEIDEYWVETGTGFPDMDYLVNISFAKKGESGIYGIGSESVDDTDVPMYDLQGRTVNPDTARPGIYIRNGKKIVIR